MTFKASGPGSVWSALVLAESLAQPGHLGAAAEPGGQVSMCPATAGMPGLLKWRVKLPVWLGLVTQPPETLAGQGRGDGCPPCLARGTAQPSLAPSSVLATPPQPPLSLLALGLTPKAGVCPCGRGFVAQAPSSPAPPTPPSAPSGPFPCQRLHLPSRPAMPGRFWSNISTSS